MADLSEFISIQTELLRYVPKKHARFLHKDIDWESNRLIGLVGGRGVGKTTLLLQHLAEQEKHQHQVLYVSADHVRAEAMGIYTIGATFFRQGGTLLVVDEVHKTPKWAQEIKSLYDAFPRAQIIFSGSSTLDLQQGKADLSRRAVYYTLPVLSFREYILFATDVAHPTWSFDDLTGNHPHLAREVLSKGPILGHFKRYLTEGAYAYFLEGRDTYHAKLRNVVDKVLYEDIPVTTGMRHSGVPVLKKVLWEIASSTPFELNVDRLSSHLGVSRPTLYSYLEYLERAGLLIRVLPKGAGSNITRKPPKLLFDNTNLIRAVGQELRPDDPVGTLRETFFVSQTRAGKNTIHLAPNGDYVVNGSITVEIGGQKKSKRQIAEETNAFVLRDDIEVGSANFLPLWLFGFLY